MKPIAVYYHCRLSGGDPPIDADHAIGIMAEQMDALKQSGLEEAAAKIVVGVNGCESDFVAASAMAPARAELVHHSEYFRGELPTLFLLQAWARNNPEWVVAYHHTKGAIHKGDEMYANWRHCMERCVIWDWKQCVHDLHLGTESIGAHWMTPERWPNLIKSPFWGGNFWWATTKFLNTLPQLRQTAENREQFYEAESWIGRGPRRPHVRDTHPEWPGATCR